MVLYGGPHGLLAEKHPEADILPPRHRRKVEKEEQDHNGNGCPVTHAYQDTGEKNRREHEGGHE